MSPTESPTGQVLCLPLFLLPSAVNTIDQYAVNLRTNCNFIFYWAPAKGPHCQCHTFLVDHRAVVCLQMSGFWLLFALQYLYKKYVQSYRKIKMI